MWVTVDYAAHLEVDMKDLRFDEYETTMATHSFECDFASFVDARRKLKTSLTVVTYPLSNNIQFIVAVTKDGVRETPYVGDDYKAAINAYLEVTPQ